MSGALVERVLAACTRLRSTAGDGPITKVLDELDAGLREPLRVAVAGRVNSGKSTLVNALLRQRVAPTDVSECTRYVTWYRFGIPERVEVVHLDGSRTPRALQPDGSMPTDLPLEGADVVELEVFLTNDALRDLVIIDTPGLASGDGGRSALTRDLLALDTRSRLGVAKADAVVFLLSSSVSAGDAEVLADLRSLFTTLNASSINAVGVLSKADKLDEDAPDPLASARAIAAQLGGQLRGSVAIVVPIIGLLAETADCGVMTEAAAKALHDLASLPLPARRSLLLSTDRFINADVPVEPEARADLLAALDLHGIERALAAFDADATTTASALVAMLRQESGVDEVERLLADSFAANADALKAGNALTTLERAAFSEAMSLNAGERAAVIDEVEAISMDPAMHRLAEMRAVQEISAGRVALPEDLRADLFRITTAAGPATRVGLAPTATVAEVQQAALAGVARWKTFGNQGRSSPAQQWLADVAGKSYERLWLAVTQGRP